MQFVLWYNSVCVHLLGNYFLLHLNHCRSGIGKSFLNATVLLWKLINEHKVLISGAGVVTFTFQMLIVYKFKEYDVCYVSVYLGFVVL